MKKKSRNTGAKKEEQIDAFEFLRTHKITETYGIKEFWRRMKIIREEKAARQKLNVKS